MVQVELPQLDTYLKAHEIMRHGKHTANSTGRRYGRNRRRTRNVGGVGVSHSEKQVNLGKIGSQQEATRTVPWNSLTYRDELDESQNASRERS